MAGEFETYRGVVYPWMIDQVGHVNVQFYTARFDEASWHLFARLGLTASLFKASERSMVALEQRTLYKLELHAGDLLEIRSALVEVNRKTVRFVHRMYRSDTGDEVASTELVAAWFDTVARRAAIIPDDVAARARALLEG